MIMELKRAGAQSRCRKSALAWLPSIKLLCGLDGWLCGVVALGWMGGGNGGQGNMGFWIIRRQLAG